MNIKVRRKCVDIRPRPLVLGLSVLQGCGIRQQEDAAKRSVQNDRQQRSLHIYTYTIPGPSLAEDYCV